MYRLIGVLELSVDVLCMPGVNSLKPTCFTQKAKCVSTGCNTGMTDLRVKVAFAPAVLLLLVAAFDIVARLVLLLLVSAVVAGADILL